jgi:hypothetical protein
VETEVNYLPGGNESMDEISGTTACVFSLAMPVLLAVGVLSVLFRCRVRQDGDKLRIRQLLGTWPTLGTGALGAAAITLSRGDLLLGITLAVFGLLALAYRPLSHTITIDRAKRQITISHLRLWGRRAHGIWFDDIAGLAVTGDADIKGRRYTSFHLTTTNDQKLLLLADQPASAGEQIYAFLAPAVGEAAASSCSQDGF